MAHLNRPKKPRPDFPLFPHASGMWAKKVRGKTHYFGPWHNLQIALERWAKTGRAPLGAIDASWMDVRRSSFQKQAQMLAAANLECYSFRRFRRNRVGANSMLPRQISIKADGSGTAD